MHGPPARRPSVRGPSGAGQAHVSYPRQDRPQGHECRLRLHDHLRCERDRRAADAGINWFDTARGYQSGNNERMVGAALKSKRQQIHISTKTGGKDKAEALAHLDTSLKELGTDYVDVWYLHGKQTRAQLTDDLLEAQQIAKKAGKIASPASACTAATARSFRRHPVGQDRRRAHLLQLHDGENARRADRESQGRRPRVVAMKVMAGGFRRSQDNAILKREGAMTAALRWVLKNPDIGTTIPSMTDMDQFEANFKCMPEKFSSEDDKTLTAHLERISRYLPHVQPVRRHLPPGTAGFRSAALRHLCGWLRPVLSRPRALPGIARDVTAVRCGDCSSCTVACPHGVKVAERISRAQELFG